MRVHGRPPGKRQLGHEAARVAAGEAVLWPAGIEHAAWTELTEMRAFVVEFAGADDAAARGVLEGRARELIAGAAGAESDGRVAPLARGDGALATGAHDRAATAAEGEPL